MRDAARGISGEYYIERDDGIINSHPVTDYNIPLLDWDEPERLGIQHTKGRVLDIGCGAGRVALYLQNQGFDVIGIDSAPGAIEACKTKGLQKAHVMPVEELDFPDNFFDTVIMYGNNFGIPGNESNIIEMLEKLYKFTTVEGIIIAGSADVEKTTEQVHIDYHRRNLERDRPKGLLRLRVKYKDTIGEWSDLYLASPKEMKSMSEKAGWKLSRIYERGGQFVGILTKS